MTKRSGNYLFALMVCSMAGTIGCGGTDTSGGPGTGTAGVGVTAGTGTAGTTAGTDTSGTIGTAGTGTAGTTAGTGTAGTTAGTGVSECDPTVSDCDICREKAEGIYAMKVELDVWWRDEENTTTGGGELADPGRGKINIYFRGEISEVGDDGNGKGKMHPCGTELPPFVASASCNAIHILFPDAMWEKPGIPDYATTGNTTGFGPGDTLTIAKTLGFLGLQLADGAAFPDDADTVGLTCPAGTGALWTDGQAPTLAQAPCFLDQDGDGNPGVTVDFRHDKTEMVGPYGCNTLQADMPEASKFKFLGAPLGLGAIVDADTNFAKQGWIGLSVELGGSGKIKDDTCSSGVGSATSGEGLPSRLIHCIQRGGANCNQQNSGFLDMNTPKYHILNAGDVPPAEWKFAGALNTAKDAKLDKAASKGPRSSVIRLGNLGETFDCAAVRSTAFLPFE
jgi:hypothetical protein